MLRLACLSALVLIASGCSVPEFEFSIPERQAVTACHDGALSPGEADVDCGETCGVACATGRACLADLDCSSQFCVAGRCADQTCTDGSKNQNESDIDCGGTCSPCVTGKACRTADDCDLAQCAGGKCRAQTCADGIANQDETDIDCGGDSGCARCTTSEHCASSADCAQAQCSKGSCQPFSCSDGIENDTETDVDCGGDCGPCADMAGCGVAADCTSGVCTLGTTGLKRCAPPTCNDGVLNGQESSVDCGSLCTTKCQLAEACFSKSDCTSDTCTSSHCVPKSATGTPIVSTGWQGSASNTFSTDTPPRYALDGNPSTHWTNGTPQTPGMWFQVDMLKLQVFFSITMTSSSQPTDYAKTLRVTASTDGQAFSELRTGIAGEESLKVSFAQPQYARYLRVELLDATDGLWWRIDDLRVLQ